MVVAGRGEGRGSWFNTETGGGGGRGNSQRKKKTKPNMAEYRGRAQMKPSAKNQPLLRQKVNSVPLTVGEACNPSESGDGNMGHIPIHAEGEGGGVC